MSNIVRAAIVQHSYKGDKEAMIEAHEQSTREAAAQGAQVMCYQELFYGPYFCQVQDAEFYSWAEAIPDGPTTKRMQELAAETGMVLVVPMYEQEQPGVLYNTAAVIDADGTYLGKYRKTHIPQVNGDRLSLPSRDFASGNHTITVTVTDSDGMSTTDSVDIQINQEPVIPEIVDDIAFTQVDLLTEIDVLANDIDLANNLDFSTLAIDNLQGHGYAEVNTLLPGHILIEYISSVQSSDNFSYSVCDTAGQCYTGEVTVFVALPDCTIMGTDEDDVLTGTSGDDVICGLGGNDTIDARGGDDIIHGGQDNDTIYARVGDDLIYGGDGDDLILAHRGDDIIRGGKGNDVIYAGGGNDGAAGGDGADKLYGEADNDNLFGDDGPDTIHGGRGDDTIYGGDGDDTIRGNAGADKIYPGTGVNTILGITPLDALLE